MKFFKSEVKCNACQELIDEINALLFVPEELPESPIPVDSHLSKTFLTNPRETRKKSRSPP